MGHSHTLLKSVSSLPTGLPYLRPIPDLKRSEMCCFSVSLFLVEPRQWIVCLIALLRNEGSGDPAQLAQARMSLRSTHKQSMIIDEH